jgi:hypothetical protein
MPRKTVGDEERNGNLVIETLGVVNIQNPSAATAAITLDANGGALIGGQAAYARNLVYNGAMQVAQRGTSTASISNAAGLYYTADRWRINNTNLGTWTQSVENDAPTGSGFRKSLKMLCTTADASPSAADYLSFSQLLEGQDVQRIAKGTSSAQQLTLSFWVKSNVTGTSITTLYDNDNNRSVSASYSISASATWEKKTVTFPADTTGAFDNDNAVSLFVEFILAAGSNFTSGTLGAAWATYNAANYAVGGTNLAAATDNYWQITGVQLEVGPVATPFEFKSFGQELAECQRYYYRWNAGATYATAGIANAYNTGNLIMVFNLPMEMRAIPSALDTSAMSTFAYITGATTGNTPTSIAYDSVGLSTRLAQLTIAKSGSFTAGAMYLVQANNTTSAYLGFSAEL